jgi:hypothetical protein
MKPNALSFGPSVYGSNSAFENPVTVPMILGKITGGCGGGLPDAGGDGKLHIK